MKVPGGEMTMAGSKNRPSEEVVPNSTLRPMLDNVTM